MNKECSACGRDLDVTDSNWVVVENGMKVEIHNACYKLMFKVFFGKTLCNGVPDSYICNRLRTPIMPGTNCICRKGSPLYAGKERRYKGYNILGRRSKV